MKAVIIVTNIMHTKILKMNEMWHIYSTTVILPENMQ